MFCRKCGHELSNEALICPKCTEPTDSIDNLNYCKNCGAKTEEGQTICSNCGASVTKFGLETSGWRTRDIKAIAKKMAIREDVRGNMNFNILYLIPLIIITGFIVFLSSITNPYSVFENALIRIIESVLISIFAYNVIAKTATTIKNGSAKFNFEFNVSKWIPFLIITAILGLITGVQLALSNINNLLAWVGEGHYGFIIFILIILLFIVAIIGPFIYYVSVARDFDILTTFKVGIKYGFKNFGKLLVLDLSFIPLVLLVGITFGILIFWKGYYIMLSGSVLFEKILLKEGFPSEEKEILDSEDLSTNEDLNINNSTEPIVDLSKEDTSTSETKEVSTDEENKNFSSNENITKEDL